jgi:ppGpp synthetase/RelA/SpoT-type nucleotidyltranferase/tetratricopeptide (TPR) repeat protein
MPEELQAGRIELAAKQALTPLITSLGQAKLLEDSYAYKHRVKSSKKLLEKSALKQVKKPEYDVSSITDVIGIRFVTLFRSQMAEVVERVLNIICHRDRLHPNPFLEGSLYEVIIYKGNVDHDPLLDEIKEQISQIPSVKNVLKDGDSKEGYSSIHIVARLSHDCEHDGLDAYKIPVEIQIRTVFEDAWGEIDHKYGYPIRSGKGSDIEVNNPGSVLAHLKVLKSFSDACANYSEVILRDAHGELDLVKVDGDVISVEADDTLIKRFIELELDQGDIQRYVEARELKSKALDGTKIDLDGLAAASEAFSSVAQSCDKESLLYLYAKMNEAFCLLSTSIKEEVKKALGLYLDLKNNFPEYPLIKHRLAQAYNKLEDYQKAVAEFDEAWGQVSSYEETCENGSDFLPDVDCAHIRTYLPKLHGYNIWLLSRSAVGEEKQNLLQEACEKSQLSLDSDDRQAVFQTHNNILYYLCELYRGFSESINMDENKEAALAHLDFIETNQNLMKDNDLYTLDTLAKAYCIYGKTKEAKELADKVIDKVLSSHPVNASRDEALEIAQDAKKILADDLTWAF